MAPPRAFIRVEWSIAVRHDLPDDRQTESRNFVKTDRAARQIRAVLSWVPSHAELVGVWVTSGYDDAGVDWTRLDDDAVTAFVDEHLPPAQRARYDLLDGARTGVAPEELRDLGKKYTAELVAGTD